MSYAFVMAVMARERWTDERLDKSFDRLDADLRELRVEMRRGFEQLDARIESMQSEMTTRFETMQSETTKRFEAMQREMTKRFDSLQSESNLRSDAVQRNMTSWFIALFSAIITCLATGVGALIALT
jgi:DNA anti-recombination protein RmuC